MLRLIVDEFWRLQRERVGDRELGDAKAYLTGSFPLTIETPDAIAMQVVNVAVLRTAARAAAELPRPRQRSHASTTSSASRRAFLRPDRLSVVLVGNAAAFAGQLSGVGFATYETVELADLDLTSASLKRAPTRSGRFEADAASALSPKTVAQALRPRTAYRQAPAAGRLAAPPDPQPVPAEVEKARALVGRVVDAKGGLARLALRQEHRRQPDPHQPGRASDKGFQTTTYIQYPDRFRTETTSPQGAVNVQVFDGARLVGEGRAGRPRPAGPDGRGKPAARFAAIRSPCCSLAAPTARMTPRVLPDVKDDRRARASTRSRCPAPDSQSGGAVRGCGIRAVAQDDVRGRHPGRPAIQDDYSGLPRCQRRPDCLSGVAAQRTAGHRPAGSRTSRSTARSTPLSSNARFLSLRLLLSCGGGLRRPYAGALVRALREQQPICRSPDSAAPTLRSARRPPAR